LATSRRVAGKRMYTDWKNYFKPYLPGEEYIPDNIRSKSLSSLAFFVVLGAVASMGLITKVESKTTKYSPDNPVSVKIQKVKQDIKALEIKNTLLESEILILNHNITQMLEDKEKQQVLRLSQLTGTHKKVGPGIVFKLSDSEKPLGVDENPNLGIIHNTDLLELINDLWAAQAHAISINNQRVTSGTEINCIGPAILVNKKRITPPFVIKAVGDPDKLAQGVTKGHMQSLELYGIKYSIEKYKRIEIPADGTIILSGDF
jgi:uncharacterized protein YlxW (UPF0749 family)